MKISRIILYCGLLSLGALTACDNAEYDTLQNQAFILQTNTDANTSQKLTIGNDAVTTSINVRLSDQAKEASSYRLVYDASALEQFNQKNQTSYTALPETAFTLSGNETTIEAGTSVSAPISLTVSPFSQELKNSGKKYAIAFRLESADGKAEVLKSGSVMVYILDQVVIQPVVVLNRQHYINKELVQTYNLSEWTVEFNINKNILYTQVGRGNNQALFGAAPSEIYIRFGDAPIEGNRLQIKTQGTQMNSQMLFNTDTWYHIAFVCTGAKLNLYVNGVLDNSMDLPGNETAVNAISVCSNSSYTLGDAMFSEVRFWSKARSQAEILNNMYQCDPTTPGLIAYYKLNEGTGSTFKDASGNGNDATVSGDGTAPTWIQNVRIDGK